VRHKALFRTAFITAKSITFAATSRTTFQTARFISVPEKKTLELDFEELIKKQLTRNLFTKCPAPKQEKHYYARVAFSSLLYFHTYNSRFIVL
jgi:hypothetical protein